MSTYSLGYAPTSASTCKGKCKMKLVKGTLRLGVSGDGPGDYTMTSYRCLDCVTDKQISNIKAKVGDLKNVDGFDTLKPEDQKKVLAKDGEAPAPKAKGKAKAEPKSPPKAKAKAGGRSAPKAEAKASRSKPPPSEKDQHNFCDKAKHFDFDAVKALVEETPELINCQPAGRWSALHQFAQGGNVEAVKWLLAHGADRNVKTKDGKTPLEVADVACKVPLEEEEMPEAEEEEAEPEEEEEEDEAEEEEEKEEEPAKSGKRKAAESASASSSAPPAKKAKGPKPVDSAVPSRESYSVVDDWSVLLNQTNVGANNNKFYKIQVLKKTSGDYFCWQHWGRVGAKGQDKLEPFGKGGQSAAETCFAKKFKDKTGVLYTAASTYDWTPKMGKYTLVETDDQEGADAEGSAPLGKLTPHQIEKGQEVLTKLETALSKSKKDSTQLNNLSSEYYTLIPHNFGFSVPPAINTNDMLEAEQELLKFYLRMGFEETGDAGDTLSPISGIKEMDLPKSLQEACSHLCTAAQIKSSNDKGETHAKKQTGKPNHKMEAHLYGAIMLYTSNAIYKNLNAVLRSEDRSKIKKYFQYLRLLLEAFDRLPQQTKTLWRGISVDLYDQYATGSTITWWGVSSCTADVNVAKNFMKGCGGKCTLLTVKTKTAADISEITFFGNEKENLLAPGTQLKVLSSKRVDKVTEITLEEVGRGLG